MGEGKFRYYYGDITLDYPGGVSLITQVLKGRGPLLAIVIKGDVTRKGRPQKCSITGFEDGGKDHKPRNAAVSRKLKGKEIDSPLEPLLFLLLSSFPLRNAIPIFLKKIKFPDLSGHTYMVQIQIFCQLGKRPLKVFSKIGQG